MTTQHTPGPWTCERIHNGHLITGFDPRYMPSRPIAQTRAAGRADDADIANARLVAAAPELLAALTEAMKYLPALAEHLESSEMPGHAGNVTVHVKRIRAAIAKAEGSAS